MPCRTDFQDDYPTVKYVPLETHDEVTRAACELLDTVERLLRIHEDVQLGDELEYMGETMGVSKETIEWATEHKAADAKRKENLKASALAKLSDEEKEVLGLD